MSPPRVPIPRSRVADQTVFPAVAAPAEAPDTTGPAEAGAAIESMVWVTAGDHRVPGTLAVPAAPPAGAIPVVLLLHGDLSNRNENGDLFTRLAAALAAEGVASLRPRQPGQSVSSPLPRIAPRPVSRPGELGPQYVRSV